MNIYNDRSGKDAENQGEDEIEGLIEISNDVTVDFDVESKIYSLKFTTHNAMLRMYKVDGQDYDQRCEICVELEKIEYGTNDDLTSLFTPLATIAVGSLLSVGCQDDDINAIAEKITIANTSRSFNFKTAPAS